MSSRLIICAAESRSQANRIVGHLINGGFAQDAVSVLFASNDNSGIPARKHPASSLAARAGVGALLGGAFVWLTGTGILSVPGLGSLVIAGTPLLALMGRRSRNGITGVLTRIGLSQPDAALYESKIREGKILISVSVSGALEALAAKRVVQAIGLSEIVDAGEQVTQRTMTGFSPMNGSMLECTAG